MKMQLTFFLIFIALVSSCKRNAASVETDTAAPNVILTQPFDGETNVDVVSEIFVDYNEKIILDGNYHITVNGISKAASVSGQRITISAELSRFSNYIIIISDKSIKDQAGNYAGECKFSFSTTIGNSSVFEAEDATFSSGLKVEQSIAGYSGTGYVSAFTNANDLLTFNIPGITKGNYDLYVGYSTSTWGTKNIRLNVNGSSGSLELTSSSAFKKIKYAKVQLLEGVNIVTINPDYTYFIIDYIQLVPNTDPVIPFYIDANLVSANTSSATQNVYQFLKENFQNKIIAGTMANYNTNIIEAQWVYDNTGKWPALTAFDLIDYTRHWNWINYTELVSNAKDYWANNGLIAMSWHWRDPSRITDEFYTSSTNFDITKVNDPNSNEYKAMISDIDTIAKYLKELDDNNVPVLWRPLHEAAGKWFWWGAKGAEPCKTLWQLLFDRLVNYHGLKNLIWVWTTNTASDALDWYPGDNYVDIIGMDIYPGENQHGSQYAQFEKAKEIFGGKKILTLSECGSVPDPALMMEYGDTWSWFMPWNGDYTRSNLHNGAQWWNTFFAYDYILTRDKMPDLK